jgi:hypothetical protein
MKRLLELARSKTFPESFSCDGEEQSNLMPPVVKARSYSPGPTHSACLACGDFDFGYDTIPLEIFAHSARGGCSFCATIVAALHTFAANEDRLAGGTEQTRSYSDYLTTDLLARGNVNVRFDRYHPQDPTCRGLRMTLLGEKFHMEMFAASRESLQRYLELMPLIDQMAQTHSGLSMPPTFLETHLHLTASTSCSRG